MKQWLKPLLSLLAVTAVSAALLFGMDAVTRRVIEQQELRAVQDAFSGVISGDTWQAADTAGESDITVAYRVLDADGVLLGYAVTVAVKGYGGEMQVHAALSADATRFLGLRVGGNQETQGYGSRVTEEAFYNQFDSLAAPASLDGYTGIEDGTQGGASSAPEAWKDGSYRAEQEDYVDGYRAFVEITVQGGRITAVNWDAQKEGSDRTKKQESQAGEYVMTQDGLLWHEQAAVMQDALIDTQDPAALVYDADTGKTDAYTGVSVSVSEFVRLAAEALREASPQGQEGGTEGGVENAASGSGEVDGVTGATVSSKAVVRAANRAYVFAAALARENQ